MVEQLAVNELVVGSSPTAGAEEKQNTSSVGVVLFTSEVNGGKLRLPAGAEEKQNTSFCTNLLRLYDEIRTFFERSEK